MAFGQGAGRVDNAALTLAKSIVAEAVLLSSQHTGLIGCLMGKVDDRVKDGYVQAERLTWTKGQSFTFPVIASSETVAKVANQAAATTVRSADPANNIFLTADFALTHYADNWDVDNYDLDLVRGGEPTATAGDYEMNLKRWAAQNLLLSLQTDICASNTQARSTLGGLPFIVDNANTYIGDRTDGAHTNLQSYVSAAGAAINLTGNVLTAMTAVQARGGWPTLGVLPTALMAKLHGQVVSAGFYQQTSGSDEVGNPSFKAMGTRFILESGLDASFSGHMYLLNEKDWRFFFGSEGMSASIVQNPMLVDGATMKIKLYAGTACINPKRQGKVTGLS